MGDVFVEGGKKTEKERRRENERERKERNRRKENREWEKKGRERGRKGNRLVLSSSAIQRSGLVRPRSKVRLRDEGYAPRGRDSSSFGLFSTLRGYFLKYGNATLF